MKVTPHDILQPGLNLSCPNKCDKVKIIGYLKKWIDLDKVIRVCMGPFCDIIPVLFCFFCILVGPYESELVDKLYIKY